MVDKDRMYKLLDAVKPFAEEAQFAKCRPDGPGYLRKSDWDALSEAYRECVSVEDRRRGV
jgi:hypothetical protein